MAQFFQVVKESGFLSDSDFKKVMEEQSKVRNSTFYGAAKRSKLLNDETLVGLASQFFGVNRIGNAFAAQLDYEDTIKAMGSIPQAIESRMFALMIDNKRYFVVNDPENTNIRNKMTTALGSEPLWAIVTDQEFEVVRQYLLAPRAISDQANEIKLASAGVSIGDDGGRTASFIDKLLKMLFNAALDRRASDLHLLPLDAEHAKVMLRVDGKLYYYTDIKTGVLINLRNKLKTMAGVGGKAENPDSPVECQITHDYRGVQIDIRVNILKSSIGYDFNFRFIDSSLRGLSELGLSESCYKKYSEILHMTKGLVLLCGPTGSGKTTLLYAGLKQLLSEDKAVFTIEDPVEIILPGTTQINVKKENGMSYAECFPSSLRHDPDVIVIGEIRSVDVAEQCVQASNTGHLVFATLHTNDAVGAIARLINLGLEPYAVGDVLAAVVAQRLVRRVCPKCGEKYELPENHPWREEFDLPDGPITLVKGKGCEYCAGSGYRGRISVNELMVCTSKVRDAIQKNSTRYTIETILKEQKFKTYREDAKDKALAGLTTLEEVSELYRDVL